MDYPTNPPIINLLTVNDNVRFNPNLYSLVSSPLQGSFIIHIKKGKNDPKCPLPLYANPEHKFSKIKRKLQKVLKL